MPTGDPTLTVEGLFSQQESLTDNPTTLRNSKSPRNPKALALHQNTVSILAAVEEGLMATTPQSGGILDTGKRRQGLKNSHGGPVVVEEDQEDVEEEDQCSTHPEDLRLLHSRLAACSQKVG